VPVLGSSSSEIFSEAPLRGARPEFLGALSAVILAADSRAVGADPPQGQDIRAAAMGADGLGRFSRKWIRV